MCTYILLLFKILRAYPYYSLSPGSYRYLFSTADNIADDIKFIDRYKQASLNIMSMTQLFSEIRICAH